MEDKQKTPEYEEYNASLEPDEDPIDSLSESELQERILEDSDMNGFQKFIARMDDAKWKLAQRVFGAFLGLGAAVALFWESLPFAQRNQAAGGKANSWSLVIAVIIALVIPNIVEKRGGRKITQARFAMAITLCIALVAFFIVTGIKYDFNFFQK